jgi:TrmH family RNA methyltransferase
VQRCERRLTIPMQGTIESLNAAMAAGILMWEMTK